MAQIQIKIRVVLYARVSTEEQGTEEHFSIEAQLNEMREYAQRKGWQVVHEFVETISGTRRDRPQLQAMLDLAARGEFDIVLVHELSRLSRSVYHTLDIFDFLGKHNVGFASVKDPDFDFADPGKRLFLIMMAAINEYYINLLSLHTSKAKRQRAKQGLYNASIVPYGYKLPDDPKSPPPIVPEEAVVVRLAYERYATGQYSHQEIADMLRAEGHHPRTRRGFPKDTIADMLSNPFYKGQVAYKVNHGQAQEVYPGTHEPIVTEQLWEQCQTVRLSRQSGVRRKSPTYRVYLLSNLACCDVCLRKLRAQFTNAHQYYREMSYERGYLDCPHQRIGVRTDVVDRQIHALVSAIELPEDWQADLQEMANDEGETLRLQRQRASLEAESRRLKEMRLQGDFDDDMELYQSELARIRRELASLPTFDDLENLGQAMETLESMREMWDEATPDERYEMVHLMLQQVRVDVPNGRVVSVFPFAPFIPLYRQMPLLVERELGMFVPVWPVQDAEKVLTIPRLPALTTAQTHGVALPFLAEYPLLPEADARIAPALSHALALCKQGGGNPEMLIQVVSPECQPLPADVRKWQDAVSETQTWSDVLGRKPESVDVLATRMLLWNQSLRVEGQTDVGTLLARVYDLLSPQGVWYLADVLPAEMPAHWVYTYFPETWEWARHQTLDLHTLYKKMQSAGFTCEVKRHVWYQPVMLGAALEIAQRRPAPLARLPDEVYRQGVERIEQAITQRGVEHLVGSEVALVEVWVQRE